MLKLHDYQKRAVEFVMKHRSTYLMLDMGLGKTAIALDVIFKIPRPAIVFAPLRVCYNVWPEEIKKWAHSLSYTILHGKDKHIRITLKRDIYLINYDGMKWFYDQCIQKNFAWDKKHILVLDESTFIKNPSSKRFNLLKKMDVLFGPYRMCLSGTPAPNGLHELWSQYYMLDHGARLGEKISHFRTTYFFYTGPPRYQYIPKQHTPALIQKKIEDITVRLDARDYNDLPEVTYNAVRLSLPEKIQKQYKKLENEGKGDDIDDLNYTAVVNNLRQFVQGAMYIKGGPAYTVYHKTKLEALKELYDTAAGKPILCALHYKFELAMIQDHFGGPLPCITGATDAKLSYALIKRWNQGTIPLLLVHPRSVGHGVNLQAGGNIVVWYNLTWSLEDYHQLNARLIRQGQLAKNVILHHLVMTGTIDEALIRVLANKEATQTDLFEAIKAYMEDRDVDNMER